MKLLLTTLNAKYVHANLALKYLYSVGKKAGLTAELREFTINNEMSYVYTEVLRGNFDMVCFSCYIWNIEQIQDLIWDLKKAKPQMKILVGGPAVSYDTVAFMEANPWIDYVIRGEGEYPFFRLCEEILGGAPDFSAVPSLSYRSGEDIVETPMAEPLTPAEIPFPYGEIAIEPDKVVYYESSRGCPYRCSYCLSSVEKEVRALPLERVFDELDFFISGKVKQVKFIDRTFNYDLKRAKEIWRHLIERDNGVTNFHFELCGEILDEEAFSLLQTARRGLFQFEIGIQSCNPLTLAAVNRSSDVNRVLEGVRRLIILGNSHIHVDLIAGLPGENYASFAESFNRVYALGADELQLGFLKLLAGTELRGRAEELGYVWRSRAPYEIISGTELNALELARLKMIEHVLSLYANKGGFKKSLAILQEETAGSAFAFFERFADFFYEAGFQHRSHKKEDLYRILMKYALSFEGEKEGICEACRKLLEEDLADTMNPEAVKKFYKKGWEING